MCGYCFLSQEFANVKQNGRRNGDKRNLNGSRAERPFHVQKREHLVAYCISRNLATVGVIEKFLLRFDTVPFSLRAVFRCVTVSLPFCYRSVTVSPCMLITSGQLKFQCAHI